MTPAPVQEPSQADADEAKALAGVQLRRNHQPYCDECGELIPPAPGRTLGDETHCPDCRAALGA